MLSDSSPSAELPALSPPPNVTSNFTDPPSLMPWIIAVLVVTMILMFAVVGIRVFTRVKLVKEWRLEDYLAIAALVGVSVWNILFAFTANLGLSRHQWDVRLKDLPRLLLLTNILETIYGPTMFALKLSVLLQLKRIFCSSYQRDSVWWILMTLIASVTIYYWACFFSFVFQCWPRAKIENPGIDGVCIDILSATLAAGIINLVTDVGMLVAPMFAIWRLQMPIKRKFGVAAVFGVGLFACITGLLGVIWRWPLLKSSDFTWIISKVGLWAMAEYCAIILVGSMPSIPLFYKSIIRKDSKAPSYNPSGDGGRGTISRKNKKANTFLSSALGPDTNAAYVTIDEGSQGAKNSERISLDEFNGPK
ncbi:hypothetical protein DM02DRAFT_605614 [Periconia macrospinosa]|uniref:Rhodopsin domain-containing protein n=1 Tax=Periconia macrospinosa TaxID=97972 RepID=A0A2V1D2I8_9PLEO|nr:hypothetical protein DM02DRAFT_605614 [Periconia macrospinosa]